MWWPRLLKSHVEIAWDDYEKDYSDLPREVMAQHQALETRRTQQSAVEASETCIREALQVRGLGCPPAVFFSIVVFRLRARETERGGREREGGRGREGDSAAALLEVSCATISRGWLAM